MFEDYASTVGIKQPQFCQPGIMRYLLENDKAKSNLKSLLPLPLTIDLKDNYSVDFIGKFPGAFAYISHLDFSLGRNFNCIANNKLLNGMKFSKAFLIAEQERQNTTIRTSLVQTKYENMCTELGLNASRATPQDVIRTLREQCAAYKIAKCVVSTELNDILEAATNCPWSSCYNPTGVYKEAPFRLALDNITAIATFYGENNKKLGRCWVHIDYNGDRLVLGRNYGNIASDCIMHVADTLWSMLGNETTYDNANWHKRRHYTYVDIPVINWKNKSSAYKGKKAAFKMGVPNIYCVHCGANVEEHGFLCWDCLQKIRKCYSCNDFDTLDGVSSANVTTLHLYRGDSIEVCKKCVNEGRYVICPHCGKYMSSGHAHGDMCPACYNKLYTKCMWCGKQHLASTECDCKNRTCQTCGQTKLKIHFTTADLCTMCYLSGI